MKSIDSFLSLFDKKSNTFSFQSFLKEAKVKVGYHLIPLKEYMTKKNIDLADIKVLFENIKNKNDYLTRFYNKSLFYDPADIHITEKPMENKHMNNNDKVQYKNIIRNMFLIEILKQTKSGMTNVQTFLDTLDNLYNKWIIENKLLAPSSLYYIKEGRIGSVFSSYFFRASIMNPYLVYSLNTSIFKGKRIFTPTLGWGSYYYGFAESGIAEYVGTDVIPSVCHKVHDFSKKYYPDIETNILCSPSEKLETNSAFMKKYKKHFDVVFFSPPYFKLELYAGSRQSTSQYPTYAIWLKEYWEKTIQLCEAVLMKKGILCYILSSYGEDNECDLLKDMNTITRKYFKFKSKQPMYNKKVNVVKQREPDEQIMIFIKE